MDAGTRIPVGGAVVSSFTKGTVSACVDRATALRFLGHAGQEMDPELADRFEQMAVRCEQRNAGRFVWVADTVDLGATRWDGADACVVLQRSGLRLPGADGANHLRGCSRVVLFAATLGQACEQELRQLKAVNTLDFLLYDACASALAEAVCEEVHRRVAKEARSCGLFAHARFSPGYGDMPLSVQPAFLAAVDATKHLGLSCAESHLLVPTKSITAMVGLFEDQACADGASPCGICPSHAYCNYLERGLTCHGCGL
ncbi:MAG: vitamin B12 dependent-methionine synthase activation domain-containing protein [Coriobacteriia bacterium]|nr:vitamin B12 dependent-methionine synthase activation domain-containing protein [Coriobacteriia bacterium]